MEKLLGEFEAEKRERGSDGSTGLTTSLQRTVSALTAQINSVRHLLFLCTEPQSVHFHSYMAKMLNSKRNLRNRY